MRRLTPARRRLAAVPILTVALVLGGGIPAVPDAPGGSDSQAVAKTTTKGKTAGGGSGRRIR